MTVRVHITDHAVLRYLERGLGVDVAGLRRRIARSPSPALALADRPGDGAALICNGLRYCLRRGADGTLTVTGTRARASRASLIRTSRFGRSISHMYSRRMSGRCSSRTSR